jgi:hypothetical protein
MTDKFATEILIFITLAIAVACIIQLSSKLEDTKTELVRLSEFDALLAECNALIPEDAYCELIARQRRESGK